MKDKDIHIHGPVSLGGFWFFGFIYFWLGAHWAFWNAFFWIWVLIDKWLGFYY